MKIAIIDYGSGNLQSVVNAIESLGIKDILITNKKQDLKKATHLILPGVGAFGDCIDGIRAHEGLADEMRYQAVVECKPFLGICVGMQVLASVGYENGEHKGLNLIEGEVKKIEAKIVPHMGWNQLEIKQEHPLLKGIKNGDHVYFANSFHFICYDKSSILAQIDYGFKMNAILTKGNIFGIQFHPEKSGEVGLKILENFLNI
ncbi:MAG TPA: imidazole glycerol phosphate synthase subunit HisH [Prolixibacteraceae bacterium]|nr:imidazole glycerol phosphate synthase subunit HisH [Prolixibacteraceae bacterium]HLD77106.1 imidazole glycerol phosphate synthase subunit HisH [Rickettsiales bacterium]